MGNLLTYIHKPNLKKPNRQILTIEYIRRLIDRHYTLTYNYFQYTTIVKITLFLQKKYSPLITKEMVEEAIILEPNYMTQFRGKINVSYLLSA
jgi:Trm5-related predicted tRNA methylase